MGFDENKIDKMLSETAEQANRNVNFAGLRDRIELERKRRVRSKRSLIKYASMAAAFVMLLGIGGAMFMGGFGEKLGLVNNAQQLEPTCNSDGDNLLTTPNQVVDVTTIDSMYEAYKGGSGNGGQVDANARSNSITGYLKKIKPFAEDAEVVFIGKAGDLGEKGLIPESVLANGWKTSKIDIAKKYTLTERDSAHYYMVALCSGVQDVQIKVGECVIDQETDGLVRALWRTDAMTFMYVEAEGFDVDTIIKGLGTLNENETK